MSEDNTYKITDRRTFDDAGEVKDKEALKEEVEKEKEIKSQAKNPIIGDQKSSRGEESKKKEPPVQKERTHKKLEIDFPTFVTSLHTSALFHFGIIPNPMTNEKEVDLDLGKQNIDILEMLELKTKGNLDKDEAALIENSLYDLRMRYVELIKK